MSEVGAIYKAIPAIMAEIGAIGKDRQNAQQGYAYRGIEDFYNTIQPLMVKHKVFSVPEVIAKDREERTTRNGSALIYTTMTVKYTFYAEDGSSVTATVTGEGMDSGDKSANKALSVAHKYALAQIFAVPTADMTDPEVDSHEIQARQASAISGAVKEILEEQTGEQEFERAEALLLRDLLLSYLEKVEGIVGKERADKLRAGVVKNEASGQWKRFAGWIQEAHNKLKDEVDRQEALLKANAALEKPNELQAALGKLGETVGAKPGATAQGELYDHG